MSAPAQIDRAESLDPGSRRYTSTFEYQTLALALEESLRAEQAELTREVLLWQRWVRYLAIGTLVLLSLVFGAVTGKALIPLTLLAGAYVSVVMSTAAVLQRSPNVPMTAWFPALLVATDAITIASYTYLTSPPQELHRILLLGFLSMQLGVFYFGSRHGALIAGLTLAAYLALALVVPPFVAGPRPSNLMVAFNVTLFALVSAVLVYTFGTFRARIDALRRYCKVVERGDTVAPASLPADQWPDGVTLLARSFQAMHARLAETAGSDSLTGCLNRRSLEAHLRSDLRAARRRGSTVAVAAIDLDHFKEINDSRGHHVGDVVLQQVASIMKATARDTDAVARYGGDEFVVVLPDTGWQGALTFADRLRRSVDDFSFGPADTPPLSMTISVGVALARGDATSADALLNDADAALYRAKTAGRNRVFS